jgi:hypothetical protein
MSGGFEQLLNRLKAEQASYALEALRKPGTKTEFEFGHRCGYLVGLDKAIDILLKALDEERHGERDLDARL